MSTNPPYWPDDTLAAIARRVAASTIPLLLYPRRWIHRRVEAVDFVDVTRLRRRVSVDFTIPTRPGIPVRLRTGHSVAFVPIALLAKRVMRNLDVRDEAGSALSILTQEQNSSLAIEMLRARARRALGTRQVDKVVDQDLIDLVGGDATEVATAFHNLTGPAGKGSHEQRNTLWADRRFRTLAADLAGHFVLFVPLIAEGGERRIIKLAYDESYEPHDRSWKQFFGIDPVPFRVLVPSLGMAESFHIEIEAPEDVVISTSELSELKSGSPVQVLDSERRTFRTHLHASHRARGALGLVTVRLRLRRAGMLLAALLISLFTTVLLAVGSVLHWQGHKARPDISGALLVALPGLFAAYLARPGEHRIVKRLVGGIRILVLLEAAISFGIAGSFAVSFSSDTRAVFWLIGAIASGIATTLIGCALSVSKMRDRS